MGKIFQKKKWFRGRHTTEEERRKKKVWPINHININHHHGESVAGRLESAVRHAARVRRRIAFVAERMMRTTTTSTTTIVFRRRLFFLFSFSSCRALVSSFSSSFSSLSFFRVLCVFESSCASHSVVFGVFWRGAMRGQNQASSGGVDALLGWAFEETIRAF